MKYIVIDETKQDIFTTECATLEEATAEADRQFSRLTDAEKKKRTGFYILESENPDDDSYLDGDIVKRYI